VNAQTLSMRERLALPLQSRIHSKSGRRLAFFISQTHLPAATINMLMQMVVPPPKYFVSQLVPKVKQVQQAQLKRMFIIERGEAGMAGLENEAALEVLLQNCEDAYGFPPYEALKEFLYLRKGEDLRVKEQAIIREALGGLPATVIRSSTFDWWSRIPSAIGDEQVSADMERARQTESIVRGRHERQPEAVSVQQ
jgi:hypothetical protein